MVSDSHAPAALQPVAPSGPELTYLASCARPSTTGTPAHHADDAIDTTIAPAAANARDAPRAREAMNRNYHVLSTSSAEAAVDAVRNNPRTSGRSTPASTE